MVRRRGRPPKDDPATERIQIRVSPTDKAKLQQHKIDAAEIIRGIARGLPLKHSCDEDLPKAS